MSESSGSDFQSPEEQELIIESDDPKKPITNYRLRKKLGEKTFGRIVSESYGRRNKEWFLAGGAIIVTVAGIKYFRREHGEEDE